MIVHKNKILIVGISSMLIGVMYYLAFRDPASLFIAKYLPSDFSLTLFSNNFAPSWANEVSGSIPTFVHAFSLPLFTALIAGSSAKVIFFSCITWASIDVFFEIIQAVNIPSCYTNSRSNIICNYIVNGVFDWNDIYSIILGSVLAFVFLWHFSRTTGDQDEFP